MAEDLICINCGKKIEPESNDVEMPSYIIDFEKDVVCIECYHSKERTHSPRVTLYPDKGGPFWVDEVFTGSYDFSAKWIDESKYKGKWVLNSTKYKNMAYSDFDEEVERLNKQSSEFAIVEINGKTEIWVKK